MRYPGGNLDGQSQLRSAIEEGGAFMATRSEGFDYLGDLSDGARQAFLAQALAMELDRNQALFLQGDPSWSIAVVRRGHLKLVTVGTEGRAELVRLWGPGDVVGHVAAFDRLDRLGSAIAIDAAEVLVIETGRFESLMRSHPEMCSALIPQLCRWVRMAVHTQCDQATETIEVRLARRLVRLCEPSPSLGGSRPRALTVGLTQEELAQSIGTSRESTARVLRTWREEGTLTTARRQIEIRRLDRLYELARQDQPAGAAESGSWPTTPSAGGFAMRGL